LGNINSPELASAIARSNAIEFVKRELPLQTNDKVREEDYGKNADVFETLEHLGETRPKIMF
jgi:hypothetical protein